MVEGVSEGRHWARRGASCGHSVNPTYSITEMQCQEILAAPGQPGQKAETAGTLNLVSTKSHGLANRGLGSDADVYFRYSVPCPAQDFTSPRTRRTADS